MVITAFKVDLWFQIRRLVYKKHKSNNNKIIVITILLIIIIIKVS